MAARTARGRPAAPRPTIAPRPSLAERRARRGAVADPEVVLEAAAAFLAVRPRSEAETRRRLGGLGYRADLVEVAIERLIAYGYLDDAAFGRAWLESRDRARPRGTHVLRRELQAKGLDHDLVTTLLAERALAVATAAGAAAGSTGTIGTAGAAGSAGRSDRDPSPGSDPDLAGARRVLARRRAALDREPDPRRRRQRAYALLARAGFDPDTIRDALATGLGPVPDDPGSEPSGPFEDP